jgi:hypothetical protein
MIDPISLVGLIACAVQLVDSAKKVCGCLIDMKQASEERQALSAELDLLQPSLEKLKQLSDRNPSIHNDPDDPRFAHLQNLWNILAEYENKWHDCVKALGPTRRSRVGMALERVIWPMRKARIQDMRVTMEGFKNSLNGWLLVDVW